MPSETSAVRDHYGRGGVLERIETALAAAGQVVDPLNADTLYPIDQLHGRQLAATREHLARLVLGPTSHVLDIGSGIGGPARYMAATFGCRVTGIDLTDEFVAVARELTRRCGLSGRVVFETGDALAMPFADRSFDAASCLHVAMNVADKRRLLSETARVLKPGARLVWSIVAAGSGEPRYPLPWASGAGMSFLVTAEALRAAFVDAGFKVDDWVDETAVSRAFAARLRAAGPPPPGSLTNEIVMGESMVEARANLSLGFEEGRLRPLLIVAERT